MSNTENNLLDEILEITGKQQQQDTTDALINGVSSSQPKNDLTVVPLIDEIKVPDPTPYSPQDDDIAFARKKMRNIIRAAEDAFNELANIANETQQPRAYEVLATLLKTATDATKELITTHKTKAEIKKLESGGSLLNTAYDKSSPTSLTQVNQTIEKAVFVGTATEMMDKLAEIESIDTTDNGNSN
jgi:hypothetical protein